MQGGESVKNGLIQNLQLPVRVHPNVSIGTSIMENYSYVNVYWNVSDGYDLSEDSYASLIRLNNEAALIINFSMLKYLDYPFAYYLSTFLLTTD